MNSSLPATLPQGKKARSFAEDSKTYGCSCKSIVGWTSLVFSFTGLVLSAIVFFNFSNGSMTAPTTVTLERKIEMLERRLALSEQKRIEPLPPVLAGGGGGGGISSSLQIRESRGAYSADFVLAGKPREYVITDIYAPGKPTLMRLCCLAGQYHMCDGSAGSGNIGLDFMLLGPEGRLLVYATSEALFGAKCTFSWW